MSGRTTRIAEEIKKEISQIIHIDVKDDRISKILSVSRVDITADLKFAKVMISVMDDEKKQILTIDALNHAASFIRTRLSKIMNLRTVPKLTFVVDKNIEYSFEIEKKLKEIRENDKNK